MSKRNKLKRSPGKSISGRSILLTLLIPLCLGGLAAGFFLFEPEKPVVSVDQDTYYLSKIISLPFQAADGRSGLRSLNVTLRQGDNEKELYSKSFPRQAWFTKAGPRQFSETLRVETKDLGIKDGKAELVISANDFSLNHLFRGNRTDLVVPVVVDTKAPTIIPRHTQRYLFPGGSGIVIYNLSEPSVKHGVMLNGQFFKGYPLSDHTDRFISYITVPWNAEKITESKIVAFDRANNEGANFFSVILKNGKDKHDNINISDGFLKSKMPAFQVHYPEMKGTDLEKFIYVNNTIRQQNREQILKICQNSVPEQLWHGKFLRMPGANMAGFADQRTYFYQGQAIDHQVHMGLDIASTANAAIRAANKGKVIYTGYIGIYGNLVILDHGQGLFSLYCHLSRIDVPIDKIVEQDELIGHSGSTGMAGGDHLHFSVLVHGHFVTPVEWLDQHWVDVNVTDALKANLM